MNHQLASLFFEEVTKTLAFLVRDHSFAPPQFEIDDDVNFAFVTFMGTNLAIEFGLDEREGDINCVICRVLNGKKATYHDAIDGLDEHGARIREYLSSYLRRRGVRAALFTRITGLELQDRIKVTLDDFAEMLRKHGQKILNDSLTVFAYGS